MDINDLSSGEKIILVGGALIIVGNFLPWATVEAGQFQESFNGLDGNGITLLFGLAAVGLVILTEMKRWAMIATGVLGVITALVAYVPVNDPSTFFGDVDPPEGVEATPELGIYVVLLGGAILVVGVIALYSHRGWYPESHSSQKSQYNPRRSPNQHSQGQPHHHQTVNQQPGHQQYGNPGQPPQSRHHQQSQQSSHDQPNSL